ncbi:hypothetical protein Tco_1103402 [Tanacetum coccineum]
MNKQQSFISLVRAIAVASRRQLYVWKNGKVRVRAVCRGKCPEFTNGPNASGLNSPNRGRKKGNYLYDTITCPWSLQISKENNTWTCKTYKDEHTCLQTRQVKLLTDKWLSNQIEDIVKPNPKIPVKALKEQLQKKYQVGISIGKVKRARAASMMRAKGDFTRQYSYLRDYRGFKEGLRELLGLDGCFMKGQYPGQLLTAVGIDANHGIYPLAYAIVETKKHTFLVLGIQAAIAQVFPNAEHRFCVRHIYENFKAQWKGSQFKELVWKCAATTTVRYFDKKMEKVKNLDEADYKYLQKIPLQHWSRSYFSGRAHCVVVGETKYHATGQVINEMATTNADAGVPESWVHSSYWVKTWAKQYSHTINPLNGEISTQKMSKNGKLSRFGKSVTCGKCGNKGHNKTTCKAKVVGYLALKLGDLKVQRLGDHRQQKDKRKSNWSI